MNSLSFHLIGTHSAIDQDLRTVFEALRVFWDESPRVAAQQLERSLDYPPNHLRLCLEQLEALGILELEDSPASGETEVVVPVRF